LSAGMSSSAAICSATAFALNKIFNTGYSLLELAKIALVAEHKYLGVNCGLMDQFVNLFGKEGNLVKINCKTEEHQYIPFNAPDVKIVLFDTGVKHNLITLGGAFKDRRKQCQIGIELVKAAIPEVNDLTDINEEMLLKYVKPVDEQAYNRCLYIVQENERVEQVCKDLTNNDFRAVGQRMFANHYGLKNLYEVSCIECDFLVDTTKNIPGVLGSRMMGAGFGGCTINLIENSNADSIIKSVKDVYRKQFTKDLKVYTAAIGNGTHEVECVLNTV
ncbi:MAG: galactokinase, partial [Pyrinomonadaceae bacterium]|nr:galactokinase [Sphingobacteriaceae bacterium]